jgi:hypothetical protein
VEPLPLLTHRPAAVGQAGVRRAHRREAVGVLGHQPQAEQPTPVLAEQRDVGEVEPVEERRPQPLDVPGVGVCRVVDRLVRPAEPDEVGRDDP